MYNADLYVKTNNMQRNHAVEYLEKFKDKIKWKDNVRVIDLGSGDGSATNHVLKKYLPSNYKEVIGCDISEEMVKFSNEHYKDEKTEFRVWNIATGVPEDLKGRFDLLFSSYAVMWVNEQERVFNNIFNMLADKGNCLLLFIASHPVYDSLRIMNKRDKWRSMIDKSDEHISPYHDSKEPAKEVISLMEKVGFTNIDVTCNKTAYIYDSVNYFREFMKALNPFGISDEVLLEEYLNDIVEVTREDLSLMEIVDDKEVVNCPFTLLVAFGSKP